MGYVRNITAHHRTLLDKLIERRLEFARASSGRATFAVISDPEQNFHETGDVSLLCSKQAEGVTGVQGTVRAAPLTLVNGSEKRALRFDGKACEIHVVGKRKPAIARKGTPLSFYKTRPAA